MLGGIQDPHTAPKKEELWTSNSKVASMRMMRSQWSRETSMVSLHVYPHTYGTAGIQTTDYLAYLGFQRSRCADARHGECYWRPIRTEMDSSTFPGRFDQSFEEIKGAYAHLDRCVLSLPQPEGLGYFFGKASSRTPTIQQLVGDGHSGLEISELKRSADDVFTFVLSFIKNDHSKGWGVHYRAIREPLSPELMTPA